MNKKFYITTAIPYVNAAPHIGHALEFVQADASARFHQLLGEEVLLLSGGDENALKNVQAAEKAEVPIQRFIDINAILFRQLAEKLDVRFDVFQKGSDQKTHYPSSQKLWELCQNNDDIYKKEYRGLYCVGCEAFYTPDELNENGECFEHPGKKLEEVAETNYFFRLSTYQSQLKELISTDTLKIYPESRKNEVLAFLEQPLQDISISRSNERAKNWGVPVPGDDSQRMYVWFDALNIYQSGIGFGWDDKTYQKWWPADTHVIGKGITRFHAIYWPAFLLSAQLKIPKSLFVHGYITIEGQKMSKTVGNVIDPLDILSRYGIDAVRYYFLREIPSFDDGDFSSARMEDIYNSELANELGNVLSRLTTLGEKDNLELKIKDVSFTKIDEKYLSYFSNFQFNLAIEHLWKKIKTLNKQIDEFAPWKKTTAERKQFLIDSLQQLHTIGTLLLPVMPTSAKTIIDSTDGAIKKVPPLFPKLLTTS